MAALAKASLIEMSQSSDGVLSEKPGGQKVEVQFNPESLKLTYANQIVEPPGGNQAGGNAGRQFVGAGTTKLALQLWFDATAMEQNAVDDVRRLTQKVVFFMTPQGDDPKMLLPPFVRFSWGSFIFDGLVEALEEAIEFFSPDGHPLRASITLTLSQQKILKKDFAGTGAAAGRPGQNPMARARAGSSVQALLAAAIGNGNWQSVASANGIEDPLRLAPGQLLDLNAAAPKSGSAAVTGSFLGGALKGLASKPTGGPNSALGSSLGGTFGSN